ncbi:MAG: hypothetical protein C3F02_02895 [Parcubacteria group bacterium]|nr:MAG: hypothetical protein C3F02_02895 [Parcubacteria group bacterium]
MEFNIFNNIHPLGGIVKYKTKNHEADLTSWFGPNGLRFLTPDDSDIGAEVALGLVALLTTLTAVKENSPERQAVTRAATPLHGHYRIARSDELLPFGHGMVLANHDIAVNDQLTPVSSFGQKKQDTFIKQPLIDCGLRQALITRHCGPPLRRTKDGAILK